MIDDWLRRARERDALWKVEREQCRACAHYWGVQMTHDSHGATRGGGERCRGVRPMPQVVGMVRKGRMTTGRQYRYCIDVREEGAPCGPEAKLFKRGVL